MKTSLIGLLSTCCFAAGFVVVPPTTSNPGRSTIPTKRGIPSASSASSASSIHPAPTCRLSSTRIFNSIQQEEDRYLELATQGEGVMARPEVVFVIMYNPGTEQEGIHTVEFPRGEESDLLLAFEAIEDCVNFSNMLRQDPNWQQEPIPTPTPLDQMELACSQMGLPIKVVPTQVG